MRIILDFQACQFNSRFRGVGRGSRALMLNMAKQLMSQGHEVVCLLNKSFPENLKSVEEDIRKNAPGVAFAVFSVPSPCLARVPENGWRQMAARILREHAIACLEPDFVHVPALLADGWVDDSIGSIGMIGLHIPTSLTQYDLIPLVMADIYMVDNSFREYYLGKLKGVKEADLFLAISEYSRREVIEWLGINPNDVITISMAVDEYFKEAKPSKESILSTLKKYNIHKNFLLYAPGGFDARKNLDLLIEAYSMLSSELRAKHQLVIASKLPEGFAEAIKLKIEKFGLNFSQVVFTDYISDDELTHLYISTYLYIFPSLHEGFGLPALEAMTCGAPVIASNLTSIPEVIEMNDAMFDPHNPKSISDKIQEVLECEALRARFKAHAAVQPLKFSWEKSAKIAVEALEQKYTTLIKNGWKPTPKSELPEKLDLIEKIAFSCLSVNPNQEDLLEFSRCFEENSKGLLF